MGPLPNQQMPYEEAVALVGQAAENPGTVELERVVLALATVLVRTGQLGSEK